MHEGKEEIGSQEEEGKRNKGEQQRSLSEGRKAP